jgi:predicted PurR-regulated permease PerM
MDPSTPPDRLRPGLVFRYGALFSFGAATTIIGLYSLYTVRAILVRILVALFIAVSLDPAVRLLVRRGVRRGLAVTLIFALASALAAAFFISVIPPLVTQFGNLVDDLPGYLGRLQGRSSQFRQLNDRYNISDQLQGMVGTLPSRLGTGLLGFTSRLFGAVFNGLTVLVFTVYFMADMPRIRAGLVRLFPVSRRPQARQVIDLVVDKVGGYMIGNIIISLIAGVVSFIAFTVLGVPFAVPLAFVVAICDLIPMIGATLGAIIGVTVALFSTELWPTTVLVAAFFVAYQQLENYFIAPRVLKTTVELGAAAVLIAGLIGAAVLGLVGALMAIPIAAAFNVLLNERLTAHETAAGAVADALSDDNGDGDGSSEAGAVRDPVPASGSGAGTGAGTERRVRGTEPRDRG